MPARTRLNPPRARPEIERAVSASAEIARRYHGRRVTTHAEKSTAYSNALRAKEKGVKLGRPETLAKYRDEAARLSREGLSGRKIAARLGVPVGSVFHLLRQAKAAA